MQRLKKKKAEVPESGSSQGGKLAPERDYGVRAAAQVAQSCDEGNPYTETPQLSAMIELMGKDGHSVDGVGDELIGLKETAELHATAYRSLRLLVDHLQASHASILSKRRKKPKK